MTDFSIDYGRWTEPKPVGISGCFRLRNESQFMETAILSHLPYLDEAVLVVQPSDDDTFDIAKRLEAEHERIRVAYYDHIPDWIDTPGFYAKNPNEPGHLVHMSNWAFSQCRYSWIAKIEGDVICLSSFAKLVNQVRAYPFDPYYYGRVILNVAGELCDQISMKHPRNAGWDECICPNNPIWRFTREGKFESLYIGPARACMGWSGLHMKRCKEKNIERIRAIEPWAAFTPENVQAALEVFNRGMPYVGIDNPLGEDVIYEKEWIKYYLELRCQQLA